VALPGRLQPHLPDPAPALPGEQELPWSGPLRSRQGGDPVHDGLRVAEAAFGGRPRVYDVGDVAAVRVDPGQVVGAGHVRPDGPGRPRQVVQPEYPAARAADVDYRLRGQVQVAPDELAG